MLMGFREYARHRGVALRAVQKAVESGRIATVGEGRARKIDSAQADQAWSANTDPGRQSLLKKSVAPLARAQGHAPASLDDDEDAAGNDDNADYRAARAQREQVRLARDVLALEQERGALIALDEAKRLVFTAARALRDAVLNVPPRLRDRLAIETDPAAIEDLLDHELSAALESLKPERVLADEDEDDDEAG